jgi:hypothetical protein
VRTIVNLGQDEDVDTADGALFLVENSFITRAPYAVVPYLNLFLGVDSPQSLARAAGAGGVLKNTGICFEGDALTALAALDASGHDAVGGAAGIQFLMDFVNPDPSLRSQLVLEVAGQHPRGNDANIAGDQTALGVRYQRPLSHRFIFRADATAGFLEDADDFLGVRFELRWKF